MTAIFWVVPALLVTAFAAIALHRPPREFREAHRRERALKRLAHMHARDAKE